MSRPANRSLPAGAAFDPQRLLASVAGRAGVYQMLDARGETLYVGKARDLKKRLASYFRARGLPPRTRALMELVHDVTVTLTRTEGEALLLENTLIKKLKPRFNVLLRDDKSYPYLYISTGHPFPRLDLHRGPRRAPGRYFGPYPSAGAVRESLALLQRVFPIRQCQDSFFKNRSRPCLQYQIKRCSGPCVGRVSPEQYAEDLRQTILFLEGRSDALIKELVAAMEQAAARREYERAAELRDRIANLRRVQERQYVANQGGDVDVVAVASEAGTCCVHLACLRGGHHIGGRSFFPRHPAGTPAGEVLRAFLGQHYLERGAPPEIVVGEAVEDRSALAAALSAQTGRRVTIRSGRRGPPARWLEMARLNAQQALQRRLAGRLSLGQRLAALAAALDLPQPPRRLECMDISHTGGEAAVASCVVFDADGPLKADYRRYNIRSAGPGDDYGAIREALGRRYRRLQRGEGPLPEVLLIDGGRGQVGVAAEALAACGARGIVVLGVAKGPGRKPGRERLFLSGRGTPLILPPDSPALHLIQHIRDEAHRFAVSGHRARRGRRRTTSPLEGIPGVGAKRRQALLTHLGGWQAVRRAGVEELQRVPGISPALARRIFETLNA